MKKTIAIIILAAILCGSAFASDAQGNDEIWHGVTVGAISLGCEFVHDFGRYDIGLSFRIPTFHAMYFDLGDQSGQTFWENLWQTLCMDELSVYGYYSIVEKDWFTLNAGLKLDVLNYLIVNGEDIGGTTEAFLSPSLQCKFRISDNLSINLSGFYAGHFAFVHDGKAESNSMGLPVGIAYIFLYGDYISSLEAMDFARYQRLYEFASISLQFRY